MATYKDYLQVLRDTLSKAQIKVVKAEEKLFGQGAGFVDLSIYDEYTKAHSEWQVAQNEMFGFLSVIKNNEIDLNAELPKRN